MKRLSLLFLVIASLTAKTLLRAIDEQAARDALLWKSAKDGKQVAQGKATYEALCKTCHGDDKNTSDAPSNLFDTKWYHGGRPTEIEHLIQEGFLEKNMPPWKEVLAPEDIQSVVAYLLSYQSAPAK